MPDNDRKHLRKPRRRFWPGGIPPWLLLGAVAILLPIFTIMTLQNLNRQKENSIRLLTQKGAALIRSFEAGTRTGMGMMGMGMGRMHGGGASFKLQRLLVETARQPDIAYLMVADAGGRILAHSDPGRIGQRYGRGLDMAAVARSEAVKWRMVEGPGDVHIFEVFRRFLPASPIRGRMRMGHHMWPDRVPPPETPSAIFVGLDMSTVEAARRADNRHTVIMGTIFLFLGFAGIFLLFLAHNYRSARRSLSRVRAFSDTLVENIPAGLLATDAAGRVVSFNQTAGDLLDRRPPEVIGHPLREAIPAALREPIRELESGHAVSEREIECPLGPERAIPLSVTASRLRDEAGQFLGHVLLFKDLREIRALRKEIEKNERLAAVGRLAAGVAHEIRNPLSSVKGFATYFRERYREVPEDLEVADILIGEVDRLNRVVNGLLEFSRPVTLSKSPVDLKEIVESSLRLIAKRANEAGVTIENRIPEDIGTATVDADRINQVLLNLSINAVEAMEGGGVLTVTAGREEEGRPVIRVSDTGTGIDPSDLSRIVDPYFTTKPTGTGLGLAIADNIMKAHGGRLDIASRKGEGTTVTLRFDAEAEPEENRGHDR
jgi:two-component system sensor histidine kinase HydH